MLPATQIVAIASLSGRFNVEHWSADGKLISTQDFNNGITNIGKDTILDVMFNDLTPIAQASWFIGIIDNAGFSALDATDTMASHTGWDELQAYTESVRQAWGSGSASGQSTTNAAPATFNMNATNVAYGVFVTSDNTKGDTAGVLWSTAAFSSTVPVTSGDQLKITYTVSA
jgi:hypothetical protein